MAKMRIWEAIALLGLAAPAAAADLTGFWTGEIAPTELRAGLDLSFQFVAKGGDLGGKLYGDYTSAPVVDGRVEGDRVEFAVLVREQAGNQINEVRYRYDGRVDGGEIELTRERASARDVVSGAEIPVRRPFDTDEQDRERRFQTFRLIRID